MMTLCLLACLPPLLALAPQFEPLGQPVAERGLAFSYITPGPDGNLLAWAIVRGEEEQGAIGIDTVTGRVHRVDLQRYRASNVRLAQGPDRELYLYAGQPGRFFRYRPVSGELTELGTPSPHASYWMRQAVSTDYIFYVGTYPRAELVACDLTTGAVRTVAALNDDPREKYIIGCAPDDHDGWVYCSVGLHHRELWAVNPGDGAKRQLLPEAMAAATRSVNNSVFEEQLKTVGESMLEGEGMAGPIASSDAFPRAAMHMIRVGEETGTLDDQLQNIAAYYGSELEYKLKRLTTLFEPAVIVFMGIVVGFVAVAMVQSIYGVMSSSELQ